MQNLEADIEWHREQIRLAGIALAEADIRENPIRSIEVPTLRSVVARLEQTMRHLEELRAQRSQRPEAPR